jgi:predicted lipase
MDNGLRDSFKKLVQTYPSYEIWVTGHSLGGALSSVAALEMIARNEVEADRVKLFTFGQPRTGDKTYASIHDKIVSLIFFKNDSL